MVLLYDGFGDREAEAGAVLLFSGEERIKDPGQDRGRNSGSVIGNGDARFFGALVYPNAQDSLFGQCIDGVGDQIREHLQEVTRVDFSGDIGPELFAEEIRFVEIFLWWTAAPLQPVRRWQRTRGFRVIGRDSSVCRESLVSVANCSSSIPQYSRTGMTLSTST